MMNGWRHQTGDDGNITFYAMTHEVGFPRGCVGFPRGCVGFPRGCVGFPRGCVGFPRGCTSGSLYNWGYILANGRLDFKTVLFSKFFDAILPLMMSS